MRVFAISAAIFLLAVGISSGQVPSEWDQWVEDGVAADAVTKYKESQKLFSQACDVSLAEALGPERLTRACLLLSRTYALQGNWRKAAAAAHELVGAQERLSGTAPIDLSRALITGAKADMANGNYGKTTDALRKAAELARKLDLNDAAAVYVDLSTFYVFGKRKDFADDLLDAAAQVVNANPHKGTAAHIRATTRVARAMHSSGRFNDAAQLLLPLVETAEKRVNEQPEFDKTWRAYRAAAKLVITALEDQGEDRGANRVEELLGGWPEEYGPDDNFKYPVLMRKVEPSYTKGAKQNNFSGMVVLSIVVGVDGRAHDIRIEKPLPYGLDWEAVRAVKQWRFRPAKLNREPVHSMAQIEVTFRIF